MNESHLEPLHTSLQQIEGVWVKFEHLNPSGSIKDRVARYVLEEGLRSGSLGPGAEVVEPTSGTNMAIALRLKRQGLNVVMFFCDSIDRYRSLPEFADL